MGILQYAAVFVLAAAQGSAPAEAGVSVVLARTAPDVLEVSYAMPPGCTRLAFLKDGNGAGRIRSRWQPLDSGSAAGADALTRAEAALGRLRFRIPVTSDKIAGYPGSFPVGEAVYAHMSNYAVSTECGPVRYRFAANGGIATGRGLFHGEADTDADAPGLLFLKRRPSGSELDYIDPALSSLVAAEIREVANSTAAILRAHMPRAKFQRPIIAAAAASEPGGPNIGGSAGDILLLSLFNWPAAPQPEHRRLMIKLVAHEMSHRFQIRDAVDPYPDARLIHEGSAEFLRWLVSLQQGWLTPQQAGAELDDALATCTLATRGRSWRDLSSNERAANRLEYVCGLPTFVYALAARQGDGSPFGRIDDFYEQLRAGAQPDFAAAIECGSAMCRPRILPALLGKMPMHEQWSAMLETSGLAAQRPPTRSQIDAMMVQAISDLVKADCGGKSSITPTPASLLIDKLATCQTVRADVVVERVEGERLFGGGKALRTMVAACNRRREVVLGIKGGTTLAMPCRVPYRPISRFYAADMRKIVQQLTR